MKVRDLIAGLEASALPDAEVMFDANDGRWVIEGGVTNTLAGDPVVLLTRIPMASVSGF